MCSIPPLDLDGCRLAGAPDPCQDVGLAQDQHFVAADLDLGAAVLREDDGVALGDIERHEIAAVVAAARADGEDGAALRLLLRRVGQDNAAGCGLLLVEDLDDQTVAKRLEIHGQTPSCSWFCWIETCWHSQVESAKECSGGPSASQRGLSR